MSDAPKIVYAVVSGSYSDYTVHVLCEDETTANATATALGDGYVEEFDFYPTGTAPVVRSMYSVTFEVQAGRSLGNPDWTHQSGYLGDERPDEVIQGDRANGAAFVQARSSSRERSMKMARDRATEVLARLNAQS